MNSVTVTVFTNAAEVWSLLMWKNLECFSILITIYLATFNSTHVIGNSEVFNCHSGSPADIFMNPVANTVMY